MRTPLLAVALFAAAPAWAQNVVGGAVTSEYTSTVALYWDGEFGCTGTIVAGDRVMTAAHCVEDGVPDHIMIGDRLGQGEMVPVADGWAHPDYDFDSLTAADVGVLLLARSVGERAVRIDRTNARTLVGSNILYVGYGDTQGTGGDGRRKVATAIITDLEGDVLVVDADNGAACFGDSGGPLYREVNGEIVVLGIVSFGYTDDCLDAGGNTRADIYADWVLTSTSGGGGVADGGGGGGGGDTGWDTGTWDTGDWDTGGRWNEERGGCGCTTVDASALGIGLGLSSFIVLLARRRSGSKVD